MGSTDCVGINTVKGNASGPDRQKIHFTTTVCKFGGFSSNTAHFSHHTFSYIYIYTVYIYTLEKVNVIILFYHEERHCCDILATSPGLKVPHCDHSMCEAAVSARQKASALLQQRDGTQEAH